MQNGTHCQLGRPAPATSYQHFRRGSQDGAPSRVDTAILGIMLFGERMSVMRMLCMGLIAAGIVGLKIGS